MRRLLSLLFGLACLPAAAQPVGTCDTGVGEAYLDVANVRARIMNTGNLFWRGSPHVYNVPKGGPSNAIFASGLWIGGMVGRQLRMAAARYGSYEFWPGPLDDAGDPPLDCEVFDRVYVVSVDDIRAFEATGEATPDLRDWPTGLGAPTLGADGKAVDLVNEPLATRVERKIDLEAGERPLLTGDQLVWWVMNDRGNVHESTDMPALGVEVHGSAFAMRMGGAVGNTTFHRYRIINRGISTISDAYVSVFVDPDLGNFDDDYIGSDSLLGLAFVYNSDNDDEGGEGYGLNPPATGFDFLQTPGADDQSAVEVDEAGNPVGYPKRMTSFVFFNGGGGVTGDPTTGPDYYNYMQARWKDGKKLTYGGNGRDFSRQPTNFMFPSDPPEFWSELNSDNHGTAISPADRRFIASAGPFDLEAGQEEWFTIAIITSFGTDHLDSVRLLKEESVTIQDYFDSGFQKPDPPDAPRVMATTRDREALLQWSYKPEDNNYLDSYEVENPALTSSVPDRFYRFEGYTVYQYDSALDNEGRRIAVFDLDNGVQRVVEGLDIKVPVAFGTDSGLRHHLRVTGLDNYRSYFFGVQAYAYNPHASPIVLRGPVARIEVVPSRAPTALTETGETYLAEAADNMALGLGSMAATGAVNNVGETLISLNVVNDALLSGLDYTVSFISVPSIDTLAGEVVPGGRLSFHVDRGDGVRVFDGLTSPLPNAPTGIDVIRFDGLSMNVETVEPGITGIVATSNLAGPLDPPVAAAPTWLGYPGPIAEPQRQQSTADATWMVVTGQSRLCPDLDCAPYEVFLDRVVSEGAGWDTVIPYDWEIRFTGRPSYAWEPWVNGSVIPVPFELWRIGIRTPDDRSDDVRVVPMINDIDRNGAFNLLFSDHPASPGPDDPFTDWFYWQLPVDTSPGESGYHAWLDSAGDPSMLGSEAFGRMSLMNWNGAEGRPAVEGHFNAWIPEPGTTFRISTRSHVQPGDRFYISGAGLVDDAVEDETLFRIGVTPNPYIGASDYEVTTLTDEVRFTNMPEQATIRIFQLGGALVRTLEKNGPERYFPWNLRTDLNMPVGSGMYLVHIETERGEQTLKLGVVKKRVQLNVF